MFSMEFNSLTSTYTLANGNKIPCLGFGTWQSADGDEAYDEGKLRALGLSHFRQHHIEALEKTAKIAPMVNQLMVCPGQAQRELCEFSRKRGMIIEGYSPMGTGKIFSSETMQSLSKKIWAYNRPDLYPLEPAGRSPSPT